MRRVTLTFFILYISHLCDELLILDAMEYYKIVEICGSEDINAHMTRAALIDEMDSIKLQMQAMDALDGQQMHRATVPPLTDEDGESGTLQHRVIALRWIHNSLLCLLNANHEAMALPLGALVHSYGSLLREMFDVGVIPASNKCLLRCNGSYMAGAGSSGALGASSLRGPRIKALCDLDGFTENHPSDLFLAAAKKLIRLVQDASIAVGGESMLFRGHIVGAPSPLLCMAARGMWELILDTMSSPSITPGTSSKDLSLSPGVGDFVESPCVISSTPDVYWRKIRGEYVPSTEVSTVGKAISPRDKLTGYFMPEVLNSDGASIELKSVDFFDIAIRNDASAVVLLAYMQATRQFDMKRISGKDMMSISYRDLTNSSDLPFNICRYYAKSYRSWARCVVCRHCIDMRRSGAQRGCADAYE